MIVTLPWPDKRLSPNARVHWRVKADATRKAREDAAIALYAAARGGMRELRAALVGDGPIPIKVSFYPPDGRHRDDDNLVSSVKAARDGLAAALGVNDRRFRPHYFFESPEKPGRVQVEFVHRVWENQGSCFEQANNLINGLPPESEEAA